MRKICAWCGKELAEPPGSTPEQPGISHGICSDCVDFLVRNDRQSLSAFLDRLTVPVLLVDDRRRVILANEVARLQASASALEPPEGRPVLVGDMIQCSHARLPEGCGGTVHCAACQVRRSVVFTFQSGQALRAVEAYLDVDSPAGRQRRRLLISTEKLGDTVLLRVQHVEEPPPVEPRGLETG